MEKVPFEMAVDLFIRDRKSVNVAPDTITYYRDKMRKLIVLLEKQGLSTYPVEITANIIKENGILYMIEKENLKISTINTYLRAWKAFFNYLVMQDYLLTSPFKKVKMPKIRKTIVQTFTKEQLINLLKQPKTHTAAGLRDFTFIMLFLETGIRVREMTDIMIDDIVWTNSSIKILGKGNKERFVYIQDKMKEQLIRYLQNRGRSHIRQLFISTTTDSPMTRRDIQYRLKIYGRAADISDVRVSPHTLRHTFARMSVENQANIFSLQAMLGHTTMDQVRHYVNMFSSEIKNDHKKFSPIENFNKENDYENESKIILFNSNTKRSNH